jgi:iron complex outermembrane receptor protein
MILLLFSALMLQAPPDTTKRDSTRATRLNDLEVTVARRRDTLRELPMAAGVVTRTELGRGQATLGLDEAMTTVPGVYVANRWNYSLDQRLSIRGAGSRANFGMRGLKVYLDGVPQTLPDGQSQLTNVEFASLDRIEVLRGASSSLYGNASGGALLLNTVSPSAGPSSLNARIEAGSFGTVKWLAGGTVQSGPWSAGLQLSQFTFDGFRQNSAAESRQLAAVARRTFGSGTVVTFRVVAADNPHAENPGALTAAELAAKPDSAAGGNILRGADKSVSQQQVSLKVDQPLGRGVLSLMGFGLWRDLDNPLATPPPGTGRPPNAGTYNTIDRSAGGFRGEWSTPLATTLGMVVGADLQLMRDDRQNRASLSGAPTDEILLDQRERVMEVGPFLQLRWRPSPRVTVDAGTRYDAVNFDVEDKLLSDGIDNGGDRTMSALSGSAGVAFQATPNLTFYAQGSTAFETPTTTELVNQTGAAAGFNPDLDPQRAVNIEAGFRGRFGILDLAATGFTTNVRDAIIQVREVGGRAYFANAGETRNRGIEAGATVLISQRLSLQAAYTLADYTFTDYVLVNGAVSDTLTGNRLSGVPRNFFRAGVRAGPFAGFTFDADQVMSSSLFADDLNTIKVASWGAGVTNLRATWTGNTGGLRLTPFVSVQNLFDRSYVGSVTINGTFGRVFEPSPGRNAYAGLEIRYR